MDNISAVVKFHDQPYESEITAVYCHDIGMILLMLGNESVASMSPASAIRLASNLNEEAVEASTSLSSMVGGT